MPEQPLPHKDTADISPRIRLANRSSQSSPMDAQAQRSLLRHVVHQSIQILDQVVCHDRGMPQRADYDSQNAWIGALLTASLEQSPDMSDFFGHGNQDGDPRPADERDASD